MVRKNLVIALVLVLVIIPAPASAQSSNDGGIVDGIIQDVSDIVSDVVDSVEQASNGIGNAVDAIVGSEGATPSGAADLNKDERQFLDNKTDDIETYANQNPESWNVRENVTKYTKFQVVFTQNGKVLDKWKMKVNWSNKSVNFTRGTWDSADVTVYPRYDDVKFLANNYKDFVEGDVSVGEGVRVGKIWRTTPCKPDKACSEIRSEYGYFIDWMIGRL